MSNDASKYKPLVTTRSFDAPLDDVWDAWTNQEQLAKWWAPDMFTVPVCELDPRPGGIFRVDMKGPDGIIYPSSGTFKEVNKPTRLVYVNAPKDDDGNKLFEIECAVDFSESNGKTDIRVVNTVVWAGPESKPYLSGMEEGFNQAIQKLEKLLS